MVIILPDIQKTSPKHNAYINSVGICNFEHPIKILKKDNSIVNVIANIKIGTSLENNIKGTHMSRFGEILNFCLESCVENADSILKNIIIKIKEKFNISNSDDIFIDIKFNYPIIKKSPITNIRGYCFPEISFRTENNKSFIKINHKITTCCPCSKEISDAGAHNQRAVVTLEIENVSDKVYWFEDLIDIIEKSGSSILYPILKRPDEKYVTEEAYHNPKFVEDVVREIKFKLNEIFPNITHYTIHVESEESIHFHNAYAVIKV